MAGGDGQGRFCHLTSHNGIGEDRKGSTATACACLQLVDGAPHRRRVRFPSASATCINACARPVLTLALISRTMIWSN